jgi:hypothetical protein
MATRRDKLLDATRALEQRLHQGSTSGHVDDQFPDRHGVRVANQMLALPTSDVSDYSDADSASSLGEDDDASSQPSESTTATTSTTTTTDSGQRTHLAIWLKSKF